MFAWQTDPGVWTFEQSDIRSRKRKVLGITVAEEVVTVTRRVRADSPFGGNGTFTEVSEQMTWQPKLLGVPVGSPMEVPEHHRSDFMPELSDADAGHEETAAVPQRNRRRRS